MPAGDATGPMGQGPMTGRAAGYCAGYDRPGFANPVGGRGRGFGRGMGRGAGRGFGRGFGWGRGFGAGAWGYNPAPYAPPAPTPQVEAEALRAQAEQMEQALGDIRARLDEIESATKDTD